jgi:hypothetical protein
VIPRNVRFIEGSAFCNVRLSSISIETGNDISVVESCFLIDILDHKLIRNFSKSSEIEIARDIEIFGSDCFSFFVSLSSIRCESNWRLTRMGSKAFGWSPIQSILIPSTILFIAFDAFHITSEIKLVDDDCFPEFDRWLELRRSGIKSDFRRIERVGFGLRCLRDYDVNLSKFEERSTIMESSSIRNEIYARIEDELLIVVKSNPHLENVEKSTIDHEIEKLINVRHPCIAGPIGFIFPIEWSILPELKIVRM